MAIPKVAIIGASGYSGSEIVRLLLSHPEVELTTLMTANRERSGTRLYSDELRQFRHRCDLKIEPLDYDLLQQREISLVFLATPNQTAHDLAPELLKRQLRLIDLSGAFRLREAGLYPRWYGFEHRFAQHLSEAVYGLTEVLRPAIREARLLANPGCYPTSALLPLIPLQQAGMVDPQSRIVCDSKSGVSGAGKTPSSNTHFSEVTESFKAYNVWRHRHSPEIRQELGHQRLIFTAHLLPINRGILSTIYVKTANSASPAEVSACLTQAYAREPLIRLYPEGEFPEVKHVAHTNFCDIGWRQHDLDLIIVSTIDNLGKGAAGQAVQNMNVMLGLEETLGLL